MKNLVEAFPLHMKEALQIAKDSEWKASNDQFRNIIISGLGGSGIGGTIVSQLIAGEADVPVVVNKTYGIPNFVNEHTLFVASSYSGNTEETLEALQEAIAKGATIACLTSGGKLLEIAKKNGYNYIEMPGGLPPRAAFGYSSTLLFRLLGNYGFVSAQLLNDLASTPALIEEHIEEIKKAGLSLANKLAGKRPVFYTDARMEGVAIRFRQQLNENSKMLSWHNVLPEMNHNELVGWAEDQPEIVPVFLRTKNDYYRTQERMEFSKELMISRKANCVEISADFDSDIHAAYYLISIGDWASVDLADIKGIDATEVDVITELKTKLSNI
ncbi:MAG: glucose/mannose-6-phosphate isomerase [Salibacteraceae bacterium]|jgi:glucose/mannose-6-phosphate isomerase